MPSAEGIPLPGAAGWLKSTLDTPSGAPHCSPTHRCFLVFPLHTVHAGAAGWLKSTLAAPGVAVKYSGVLNGIGECGACWFCMCWDASAAIAGEGDCCGYLQVLACEGMPNPCYCRGVLYDFWSGTCLPACCP